MNDRTSVQIFFFPGMSVKFCLLFFYTFHYLSLEFVKVIHLFSNPPWQSTPLQPEQLLSVMLVSVLSIIVQTLQCSAHTYLPIPFNFINDLILYLISTELCHRFHPFSSVLIYISIVKLNPAMLSHKQHAWTDAVRRGSGYHLNHNKN